MTPAATPTPTPRQRLAQMKVLPRIALTAALAACTGAVTALASQDLRETPWLVGWLTYCALDALYFWRVGLTMDARGTRARAQRDDPGTHMLLALTMVAAFASVVAVVLAVQTGRSLHGAARWVHLLLAAAALAGSWWQIQISFARHYARAFYRHADHEDAEHAPLAFPGGQAPDYMDFLYQSLVVGMTSQVSDVEVRGRSMRRLTLTHGVLSFVFNLVILALAVNVLAGTLA
jgi:uncharacterized membrane protein